MEHTSSNILIPVRLSDGLTVEAVYFGSGTLCLSTQAGCALGCPFCASGARGLLRNLTIGELEKQVEQAREKGIKPLRLTLSGIGEPLHNSDVVIAFLEKCRKNRQSVSVTTTGVDLGALARLLPLDHNGVALSLHAGTAAVHHRLVPHGPPFEQVWDLLQDIWPGLSHRRRKKISVNYLLLQGINDADDEISELVNRLRPFPEMTLHLLQYNKVAGSPFSAPPAERQESIYRALFAAGINVRRANRWRIQPAGGCGTLFLQGLPI
ncbi:MAG: radical SAM protein [Syntrophotaleaceae bacterium]